MGKFDTFKKFTQEEFAYQALPVLQEVFNYPGSFLQMFKPKLPIRIIDKCGTMPNRELLNALKIIGADGGYNGCYYTFIDYYDEPTFNLWLPSEDKNQSVDSWYVPFDEMKKVDHLCAFCQSFISPKGDWGIFVTRDNFLVLGCTPEVGKKLHELIPEMDKSIYRFLEMYDMCEQRLHAHWDWLPELIHHLYGEKYDSLLQKYNFHPM
jgi:hypothetical protein